MKNIKELRSALLSSFEDLVAGKLSNEDATAQSRLSSNIIQSAKVEADYNKQMRNKKKIDFLENE